ncbi:hypothetical protein OPJ39_003338 [Pseudomonas aeruginosa]|nr:hypothetical protein [Pseudomonas aeruginosa]EKV8097449.1 hypothetical protein [Pseudomonas aeruginosa]EKW6728588.1 hypothetical protein [Pseudomonas aeruginosa]HED1675563.1 hypothetical protein [Pseudomonas aeruginosa]
MNTVAQPTSQRIARMDTPVTFDWKIRLPDVLGVLRRDYAGRFPQLASAALETLLERLRDDLPEDFLPALGQELESLGLALVERLDEDDSLNLYVVGATHSRRLFDALAAQGHNARTLRQEDAPEGARAALPAAAPAGLAPASAYICLEHAEHLAPGLAIARLPGEDSRNLLDLRQWPRLQRLPDGAEETQGALLCRASSADGLHAWVRMTRSGSPYAWLHRSRDLASLTPELPPLPLPPAQSLRQRRTPELAIGLAGNDLLLADRGLFFLYPGFAQGNDEPRLLFDVPQARRSIENPPAVFTTPDQRVCLLSRGQFFEWREARIQPLPFPVGKDLPADPAQPTSAAPGTIVWLERETLCEGRLDSGEIRSHSLDGLAEGPYLKLQALDGGWLLLAPWLEPHRSRDLAQLWHLESGRALRIRYGELDLEGGLQHWAELPDGRIVVGDHARHVDLGTFESLRQRLLRRRLAPA